MELPQGSNQPIASGEHPFDAENSPYEAIGGDKNVRALVDAFYVHMGSDSEFVSTFCLYPEDIAVSREKLYMFISGWLGGPQLYVEKYGHPRLKGRHMPFVIGELERDHWLKCMQMAMDEVKVEGELRSFLDARFTHVANFLMNVEWLERGFFQNCVVLIY